MGIKEVFRVVPVCKEDWRFLGMCIEGKYFVDTVLPMGCGTSCAIFQKLTRAVCWLAKRKMPDLEIFGFLDDFLLISREHQSAVRHLAGFEELCKRLGVPLAKEKTVGPVRSLVFLGIGLDTERMTMFLDDGKKVQPVPE